MLPRLNGAYIEASQGGQDQDIKKPRRLRQGLVLSMGQGLWGLAMIYGIYDKIGVSDRDLFAVDLIE